MPGILHHAEQSLSKNWLVLHDRAFLLLSKNSGVGSSGSLLQHDVVGSSG